MLNSLPSLRINLLITLTTLTFTFTFIAVVVLAQEDLEEGQVHLGSYGYICTSECRKHGYSYSWCEAKHPTSDLPGITKCKSYLNSVICVKYYAAYWDYCSKKQEHDYRGRRCWHEHACGNHGYKYKWCYIGENGSSWGYCGLNVQEKKS